MSNFPDTIFSAIDLEPFCARTSGAPCLIPAWLSNHMPCKVWDEIIYPFPNYNCETVDVWEWISNFISYIIVGVITNPCWDYSQTMSVKGATADITMTEFGSLNARDLHFRGPFY